MRCSSLQQTGPSESTRNGSNTPPPATPVVVIGAGPAGCAAAIAAIRAGSPVHLYEKSRTPRHKVCGEFLSPGLIPLLEELGVWTHCLQAGAVPLSRMILSFPRAERTAPLPATAYGLSRFVLDSLLLRRAEQEGVCLHRSTGPENCRPLVLAAGRRIAQAPLPRGSRLFGFKAHFRGPQTDAIELYFAPGLYIGLNPVEDGRTNICGLGQEDALSRLGFKYDAVCASIPALAGRMLPLQRCMDWLSVGPVSYRSPTQNRAEPGVYAAGDSLSFIDPFTGSGITNAVFSGMSAGRAAATESPAQDHLVACRRSIERSYFVSTIGRGILSSVWLQSCAALIPPRMLFRLTRPDTTRHRL